MVESRQKASAVTGEAGSQQGCPYKGTPGQDMWVRSSTEGNVLHRKMQGNRSSMGDKCAEYLLFELLELHILWLAMTDGPSTCESIELPSYQPVRASVMSVNIVPMPIGHSKVPIQGPSSAAISMWTA